LKQLISILIFTLMYSVLVAQEQQSADATGFTGVNVNITFGASLLEQVMDGSYEDTKFSYTKIKGSPFINDEAVKCDIVLHNGDSIKDIDLQFDLYIHKFIAKDGDGEEVLLDGYYFNTVMVPYEDEVLKFEKLNPEYPDKFYIKLFENKDVLFFKEMYVSFREGSNQGLAEIDAQFTARKKYYIKNGDLPIRPVKLKEKDVFKDFSKRDVSSMTKFARSNKIKLKKEADFLKAFDAIK